MKFFHQIVLLLILVPCAIFGIEYFYSDNGGIPVTDCYNSDSPETRIIRDSVTKAASLVVVDNGGWELFSGITPKKIDHSSPILEGNGSGTYQLAVSAAERRYFLFRQGDKEIIFAERVLPMNGGYNFRDLGGLAAANGKKIRWGMLFRSGDLDKLTPVDLAYLASFSLRTVVDFRTEAELERAPDKLPRTVTNYAHLLITPGRLDAPESMELMEREGGEGYMRELYRQFATDEEIIKQYREFFVLLQNEKNLPLLFHCSAGKDRTGYGAALILFSLGVDTETIMKDYLASGPCLGDKYDRFLEKYPQYAPMIAVKPEYLQSAVNAMKERSGSIENYLAEVLGVDIDRVRAIYLE